MKVLFGVGLINLRIEFLNTPKLSAFRMLRSSLFHSKIVEGLIVEGLILEGLKNVIGMSLLTSYFLVGDVCPAAGFSKVGNYVKK